MKLKISSIPAERIIRAAATLPSADADDGCRSVEVSDSRLGRIRITFRPVCSAHATRKAAGHWEVERAERVETG